MNDDNRLMPPKLNFPMNLYKLCIKRLKKKQNNKMFPIIIVRPNRQQTKKESVDRLNEICNYYLKTKQKKKKNEK